MAKSESGEQQSDREKKGIQEINNNSWLKYAETQQVDRKLIVIAEWW